MSIVKKRRSSGVVLGPGKVPLELLINGEKYSLEVEPRRSLLDVLRDDLNLTGSKKGCDMGECGACTVILDGKAVYSCLILAVECEGQEIHTIEGLAQGDNLDPIQQAFVNNDAYQCGFCTPGQIMSVRALLERNPDASQEEIHNAVSGNICRCGAYPRIFTAAEEAARDYARKRSGKKPGR
jgi:aerobic-type carbon monoxide dehydrogenase small subunit (CoxS/CutS family)